MLGYDADQKAANVRENTESGSRLLDSFNRDIDYELQRDAIGGRR